MLTKTIISAIALTAIAIATTIPASKAAARDATGYAQPDIPWTPPDARTLGGKRENQLNVNSATSATTANTATTATTAGYANNAGALGGGDLSWVRNNALYATSAGSANTANSANSANTANTASYSTAAGNGVSGISSGKLNLQNGTQYTLPTSGGSGSTFSCSSGTDAQGFGYYGPTVGAYGWANFTMSGLTCQCTAANTFSACRYT